MRKEIIREGLGDYFDSSTYEILDNIPIEIIENYSESAVILHLMKDIWNSST